MAPHSPRTNRIYTEGPITATEAKKAFGRVLEKVIQGGRVVITKHNAPKAVLISMQEFNALLRAPELKLNTLAEEFDALLDRMQRPGARKGMQAAFDATPHQLGKAALAAARKRG
jgi:antitoxin Phd